MFSVFRRVSPNNVCFVAGISVTILPQFREAHYFFSFLMRKEKILMLVSTGW